MPAKGTVSGISAFKITQTNKISCEEKILPIKGHKVIFRDV